MLHHMSIHFCNQKHIYFWALSSNDKEIIWKLGIFMRLTNILHGKIEWSYMMYLDLPKVRVGLAHIGPNQRPSIKMND